MTGSARPVLVVVAGPNGSGKTTLTERVLKHEWLKGCIYINPDNIARDLFGDWNDDKAVLAAANFAQTQREKCLSEFKSMAFESVLSAHDKIDFIRRAKEAGFFVRLFFVGTDDPAINAARIAKRVLEGGHSVPIAKIIERHSKSIANCAVAAKIADRAYIYDNSIDHREPQLLFRSVNGQIHKLYDHPNSWSSLIIKALSPRT